MKKRQCTEDESREVASKTGINWNTVSLFYKNSAAARPVLRRKSGVFSEKEHNDHS